MHINLPYPTKKRTEKVPTVSRHKEERVNACLPVRQGCLTARPFEFTKIIRKKKITKTAFTYIEILITLAILAVLFVPMMRLFSSALFSATVSGDLLTAVNLGRAQMERVKNLNLSKEQLRQLGILWTPPLEENPLMLNKGEWRVRTTFKNESDPLQVEVDVFLVADEKKPVVSLVTLIEDPIWSLTQ